MMPKLCLPRPSQAGGATVYIRRGRWLTIVTPWFPRSNINVDLFTHTNISIAGIKAGLALHRAALSTTMSNALTLTGAFALGLPISVGFAAFNQLVRWRASKYVQSIPNASEVDQEALNKERAESTKDEKKNGHLFGIGTFCASFGFFQLLNYLSGLYMVIMMGIFATLLGVSLARCGKWSRCCDEC
jgi:hypothetical protein